MQCGWVVAGRAGCDGVPGVTVCSVGGWSQVEPGVTACSVDSRGYFVVDGHR